MSEKAESVASVQEVQMTTEEVTLEIADTRPNDVELETFEKEVVTKTKKKATTRKKKPEIIADIQRLRPGQYSESMLRKMRKAELEDMLVRLLEDSISVCSEIPPIQEPGVEAPPRNDIVAKTMYNGVILFSNLCEMLSWQTKRYTGGYVLDNFSQQLEQNKEDLQEICVELAEEYQEVVAAYCSVESRLASQTQPPRPSTANSSLMLSTLMNLTRTLLTLCSQAIKSVSEPRRNLCVYSCCLMTRLRERTVTLTR